MTLVYAMAPGADCIGDCDKTQRTTAWQEPSASAPARAARAVEGNRRATRERHFVGCRGPRGVGPAARELPS
jgi:hypothetical protein